jgi:hypothetical protein
MAASDDHTTSMEQVTVYGYEIPKEKDERTEDPGTFETSFGDRWSGSIGSRSRGGGSGGRNGAGGLPSGGVSIAAGLHATRPHAEGAAGVAQGIFTHGALSNPDRIAEAEGGPLLSGGSESLTRLQRLGIELGPVTSRPSDTSHGALPRAERSAPASRTPEARPERGIRVGAPSRPSLRRQSAPSATGVRDTPIAGRETRTFSTRSGGLFFGTSQGAGAMAALGIGVGAAVSIAATAAIGPLGDGKTGAVTAGVFMVMAGAGVSISLGPSWTITYERATDSPSPAGLTAECVPQLVVTTPMASLQFSGQNLDSAITLSYGLALALGVFSGVSCGVALQR